MKKDEKYLSKEILAKLKKFEEYKNDIKNMSKSESKKILKQIQKGGKK